MSKLPPLLRALPGLLRWPSLLMVALSQWFLHQYLLQPYLDRYQLAPAISVQWFWVFQICTLSLAAGANIINDYFDTATDAINRPRKKLRNAVVSRRQMLILYFVTLAIGLICSILISAHIERWQDLWIFPFCAFCLFYYSWKAKGIPIAGNLLVAAFCGMIVFILIYAEQNTFDRLSLIHPSLSFNLYFAFAWLGIFSTLSNWFREIVKDLEDLPGDRAEQIRTFPVVFGLGASRVYGGLVGLLMVAACVIVPFCLHLSLEWLWWVVITLPGLYLFLNFFLIPDRPAAWRTLQLQLKLFMLLGFLLLILLF